MGESDLRRPAHHNIGFHAELLPQPVRSDAIDDSRGFGDVDRDAVAYRAV